MGYAGRWFQRAGHTWLSFPSCRAALHDAKGPSKVADGWQELSHHFAELQAAPASGAGEEQEK